MRWFILTPHPGPLLVRGEGGKASGFFLNELQHEYDDFIQGQKKKNRLT